MIAYFDLISGISGDMTLGALIDLGVPVDWLQKKLTGVLTGFNLKTDIVFKHHLGATDLTVEISGDDHTSRNYTDIRAMIENSSLSEEVKLNSLAAFKKIARAEARIHGKDIETVHFHEIGGIDSIVDIVGSFMGIEYLGIKQVFASNVPLGSGVVSCAHGKIPVPVPATLDILKGIPVVSSDATTEIVTPTGAAIIATLADSFGPMPGMAIRKTGYGSGKRETGSSLPNLLRIVLGEGGEDMNFEKTGIRKEQVVVATTNVDDMSPEISGFLMETLFENHALDVCYVPVGMKKNRPGIQIEVVCRKEDLENIVEVILTQTTSIGVRWHTCERAYLQREIAFADTRFGPVQVKKITGPDRNVRCVPEYEVVKEIAKREKIPLKDVYNRIQQDANPGDAMPLDRD